MFCACSTAVCAVSIKSFNLVISELITLFCTGFVDVELKDVFLYKFKNKIRLKYFNYIVIYPPSNEIDNINKNNEIIYMFVFFILILHYFLIALFTLITAPNCLFINSF